jgi:hypothetical protein
MGASIANTSCIATAFVVHFVIYCTRRYGALCAPSSSSCGGLLYAAFGCNFGTFGPNWFVVAPNNSFIVTGSTFLGLFRVWFLTFSNLKHIFVMKKGLAMYKYR